MVKNSQIDTAPISSESDKDILFNLPSHTKYVKEKQLKKGFLHFCLSVCLSGRPDQKDYNFLRSLRIDTKFGGCL